MYKWHLVLIYLYKDYTTFKRVCIEIFFHILAHNLHFDIRVSFSICSKATKWFTSMNISFYIKLQKSWTALQEHISNEYWALMAESEFSLSNLKLKYRMWQ